MREGLNGATGAGEGDWRLELTTEVESVSASRSGRIWLLFGVDSGFESLTEVYLTRVSVTFAPMR